MTVSEVIQTAWSKLRAENYSEPGVYERRIYGSSGHSVFAAIRRPGTLPLIQFRLASVYELPLIELRGVALRSENTSKGATNVQVELLIAGFEEVFISLVADIVSKVLSSTSEAEAVVTLIRRLEHWQRFLQVIGPQGLSIEQQVGLFGELIFLQTLLQTNGSAGIIVPSWRGPSAANHDFICGERAVEVKTTISNNWDTVQISNEHQLDSDGLQTLVLLHLCLEAREDAGTTLPALIAEIRLLLPPELDPAFTDLLADAGYLDTQQQLYQARGFTEKRRSYYLVRDGFPRIIPGGLQAGLSQVRYRVSLSGCNEFSLPEEQVLADYTAAIL